MIYQSNLPQPRPVHRCFNHLDIRPMPHSMGHSVASDWADKEVDDPVFGLYKNCGLWTHDEAAILLACASQMSVHGEWVDIGAHTGWTSKHINWGTNSRVLCVDPMLAVPEFCARFEENTQFWKSWIWPQTSTEFFESRGSSEHRYKGFCIDGDHEPGEPLKDVINAFQHLAPTGVILLHDFIGQPVRDAATWLMLFKTGKPQNAATWLMFVGGMKCRVYRTPHMVAVLWRGDFTPPDHVPDPKLPDLFARCPDFDFSRCS